MLHNRHINSFLVILIISFVLISSFASIGVSLKSKNIIKTETNEGFKIKIETPKPYLGVKNPASIQTNNNDFNNSENIVISNNTDNESNPSVIFSGISGLISYLNEDKTRIFLRNTQDYGKNWSNEVQIEVFYSQTEPDIEAVSPDLAFSPGTKKAYGTYVCPKGDFGVNGFFITPDIDGDLRNTVTYTVDWTFPGYDFSFWGFKNPEIVAFNNATTPWVITMIGSTDYIDEDTGLGACNNSTMFMYYDLEKPELITLVWFPDFENCSNLTLVNEFGSDFIYGACEIKNDKYTDIMFFKGNPAIWYDENANFDHRNFSIPFGNLKHPKITVSGSDIYIVAEKEKDGLNEIVVYHSNNKGANFGSAKNVISNQEPSPDFSVSAKQLNAYFIDNSTDEDGFITSWLWDFGDGNTSSDQNPHHIYGIAGDYSVSLTVIDDDNTPSSTTIIVNMDNTTPIANFTFTPPNPAPFDFVYFFDTSIQYDNYTNDNWVWDFGDSTNLSYLQNPIHDYIEEGIYEVTLKIKNETINKTDTITKIIKIGFIADFSIEPEFPTIDDTIYFNDTSSNIFDLYVESWVWDMGDGVGLFNTENVSYSYSRPDIYQVTLTVKDNINEIRTISKNITIRPNKLIPSYPAIFANQTEQYCVYSEGKNIYIINSTDEGNSWDNIIRLNSLNGSVVEEYKNAFIPDGDHVVWVDDREGKKDIYSTTKTTPNINLRIVPDSVEIAPEDLPFFQTNNRIRFTIENQGTTFVEEVEVIVTIEFRDEVNRDPINTSYPAYIYKLDFNSKKTFDRPLFRLTLNEIIRALYDFAGMENITITIDTKGKYKESNLLDNSIKIPVLYSMVFSRLGILENLFLMLD
jgi:PKD repeat protein